MKFLEQVAQHIISSYNVGLEDVTLVFPGRRAALFFQQYLSRQISNPVFLPQTITISDLVGRFSDLQVLDHNQLIVRLYRVYNEVTQSQEPLDEFYYWGEMMLADFNEIDKYLIDVPKLFKNVESLKEIDWGYDFLTPEQLGFLSSFWENFLKARNSDTKIGFLNIWKQLLTIYNRFSESLLAENLAYEGLQYRQMVGNMDEKAEFWAGRTVCFVGFNALNECERKLFNFLKINANTRFFWDYDDYYLLNADHEAGLFIRENLFHFPMPNDFIYDSDSFSSLSRLDVVSITGNTGQSVYVSKWLNESRLSRTSTFDNAAVVLCDEKLLHPVLQTIPDYVEDINITMGYPFRSSVVYGLLKGLAELDRNSRKDEAGTDMFYFRFVLSLLGHPLLKPLVDTDLEDFTRQINNENKIYLTNQDFDSLNDLKPIFKLPLNAYECRDYLQAIIGLLFKKLGDDALVEKETLHLLYLSLNQVHTSLFGNIGENTELVSKRLFYQLLLRHLEGISIPFEGEPLKGLQIIGFLETRCLDFDHLVILSASDNNLPGNPHRNSFIPFSLRKGFGLPVAEHRQAMYAYYFYRLLQRAKTVSIVYDNRTDGLSRGEVSRFVTQLKYETKNLQVFEKSGTFSFEPPRGQGIVVDKQNEKLAEKIEQFFQNGQISPTAINAYLDCSLRFYFQYIEGMRQPDEIAEDIDNMMFGRVAHTAIQFLYEPFVGREIRVENIANILDNKILIDKALNEALRKEFFKHSQARLAGGNLLTAKIIEQYLRRILLYDKSIAPFSIVSLEKKYTTALHVQANNKVYNIYIGGSIDRVDKIEGDIRIVDYKTGKSDNMLTSVDDMFFKRKRNKAAFQTMLYAHCYHETCKTSELLLPAVYGASDIFTASFNPLFYWKDKQVLNYQGSANEYLDALTNVLGQMINLGQPFEQTLIKENCRFCAYNGICNRV